LSGACDRAGVSGGTRYRKARRRKMKKEKKRNGRSRKKWSRRLDHHC